MKRLDLQLFANEAVQGKKLVYLYRILSKKALRLSLPLCNSVKILPSCKKRIRLA